MLRRVMIAGGALLLIGFAGVGLDVYRAELRGIWRQWRYPPPAAPAENPLGEQILGEIRDRRVKEVSRELRKVWAQLDQARAKGFNVSQLEPPLALALKWEQLGKYREALVLINSVEMRIPRKQERVIPAAMNEGFVPERKKIEGAPVKPNKKKHRRAKKESTPQRGEKGQD